MIDSLFGPLQFWHWLALAAILVGIEVMAPGVFFLWLAAGAAITGLTLLVLPDLGWEFQLLVFAAVSVFSIYGGRRWIKNRSQPEDHPHLNERGAGMIGQIYTLSDATQGGRGRLKIGDSSWSVRVQNGADLTGGTRVEITAVDGSVLEIAERI